MQGRGPSRKQRVPPLNKCTGMPEIIPGTSPRVSVKIHAQSAAVGNRNTDEHTGSKQHRVVHSEYSDTSLPEI